MKCRICGCTDLNCQECVILTGHACSWVEPDLCSACVAPRRIQRRRTRGWRKPPGTVNVTRGSLYGNPFKIGEDVPGMEETPMDAQDAVDYFTIFQLPKLDLAPLRGQHIMCWCGIGQPCHGDVLLKAANK